MNLLNIKNIKLQLFLRLLVIVIIPFILFLYSFTPTIYNLQKERIDNKTFIFRVVKPDPNPQFVIRNLVEQTFDIKYYKFCFTTTNVTQDFISYPDLKLIYTEHEPDINYLFIRNNVSKIGELTQGKEKCEIFEIDENLKLGINIVSNYTHQKNESVTIIANIPPNFDLTHRIKNEFYSVTTKILLSLVGYWGILWLFTRMLKLYREGIFKNES